MAKVISIEDFRRETAIEVNGEVFDIPERTAENYEALVEIEGKRESVKEYDYCKAVLELLFGKNAFKKLAPKGRQTNLDYLAYITNTALELFLSDKVEAQKRELDKQVEEIEPLVSHLKTLQPVLSKMK